MLDDQKKLEDASRLKKEVEDRAAELKKQREALEAEDCQLPPQGLLVKAPFAQMIVDGRKKWELRTRRCWRRGKVAILLAGSKTAIGEVTITDSIALTQDQLSQNFEHHRVHNLRDVFNRLPDQHVQYFAWVLEGARKYKHPKPYAHPVGAVVWVTLIPQESRP